MTIKIMFDYCTIEVKKQRAATTYKNKTVSIGEYIMLK